MMHSPWVRTPRFRYLDLGWYHVVDAPKREDEEILRVIVKKNHEEVEEKVKDKYGLTEAPVAQRFQKKRNPWYQTHE